jgi:radical SAM superfamily enzyme YgiQ (UPF0313 family)
VDQAQAVHRLGTRTRVLLSSVYGPYARDDDDGSRTANPMELYHNQVTRTQGAFSLRMFHRSFGLMLLQANMDAPCTLLDFPTLEEFTRDLKENRYDVVGISSILVNLEKVNRMCGLVRRHQPGAEIVVGGHIAGKPDIHEVLDADHIVRGDGVRWFRRYLGQDEDAPVKHPVTLSGFNTRILGVNLPNRPSGTAGILIPSVGCPVGCNFCSTSAMFGGKGCFVNFYETGDELYNVMAGIEEKLKVRSFFILDENFLLHRQRALRLLELMEQRKKSWSLYVFSSMRVLSSYTTEQLIGLGIGWVWAGLEGEDSRYAKLKNVDTKAYVRYLQSHGIRVLGSSIIGLENHTSENIDHVIDHAVSHDTDFHQFMLYTPVPGTPLYEEHRADGTMLPESEFPLADAHGQYRFNYRHPHIRGGLEEQYLVRAFERDFEVNGPSLYRLIRTMLRGWKRYKNHPDARIRGNYRRDGMLLRTTYAGAVWAMRKRFANTPSVRVKLDALLADLYREFGLLTRLMAAVTGRYVHFTLRREEKRLARGWSYEPRLVVEKNDAALALTANLTARARALASPAVWVSGGLRPGLTTGRGLAPVRSIAGTAQVDGGGALDQPASS